MLTSGDRVFLMDGYHGPLNLSDLKFSSKVSFAPVPGQTAHVDVINVINSSNLVLDGLKVWPTSTAPGTTALVRSYPSASDITFSNLDVRGHATAGNYMSWPLTTWTANKRPGFLMQGQQISAIGNRVTGVQKGIEALGQGALIEKNIVDGFSGDGLRALGDNSVVRGNKVQNCFDIDGNHDDAFQSFTRSPSGVPGGGVQKNLLIEDNKFFEWASSNTNPLRCMLQGIGMFDGMFDGVTIRNNVISVSAYHGIAVFGALNSTIINNTVVDAKGRAGNFAWIYVNNHKNGTRANNVVIANNLTTKMQNTTDATRNILVTNNLIVTSPSAEFTAASTQDYTLRATSKAANTGSAQYATPKDIMGVARPKGKGPDVGAYESQ